MHTALNKLAIALARLFIDSDPDILSSVYYVYPDELAGDDLVEDHRLMGRHIEVTVKVVSDSDDFIDALFRHNARNVTHPV